MKPEYNSRVSIFTNEYELLDGYKKRLDQLNGGQQNLARKLNIKYFRVYMDKITG